MPIPCRDWYRTLEVSAWRFAGALTPDPCGNEPDHGVSMQLRLKVEPRRWRRKVAVTKEGHDPFGSAQDEFIVPLHASGGIGSSCEELSGKRDQNWKAD